MKLAKVKIEYSSGTTIVDRVSLDPVTGRVYLAPRVLALINTMEQSECSPSFSLQYKGYVLPVAAASGEYSVSMPVEHGTAFGKVMHSIAVPSKEQRQQNGRYLHTLSAASIGGAAASWHAALGQGWDAFVLPGFLAIAGVLLWYAGIWSMEGE
jgi:hypothetical protein